MYCENRVMHLEWPWTKNGSQLHTCSSTSEYTRVRPYRRENGSGHYTNMGCNRGVPQNSFPLIRHLPEMQCKRLMADSFTRQLFIQKKDHSKACLLYLAMRDRSLPINDLPSFIYTCASAPWTIFGGSSKRGLYNPPEWSSTGHKSMNFHYFR